MGAVRRVDAVNTPNRKPQVTNCTEIDRSRSKALVDTLTDTESRGSSPLSSTRKIRFQDPDFRAFDDNRDDNRDFFDDNRPDDSSPTCSNRAPIESKASRCTASITST